MNFWSRTEGPLLYAHRGASKELPENSLAAFRRALELGADVLELDVHPSQDGVFVVSHDPTGERTCGVPKQIAEHAWTEISAWGERLCRFQDVLEEFPEAALNVDVKMATASQAETLVTLIRERRAEERVLLTTFSWRGLRLLRGAGYRGALGLSQLDVVRLFFAPALLGRLVRLPGVRAQVPLRSGPIDLSSAAFIAKCHGLGLKVDYWVVNEPAEAALLLERGADGIITDDTRAIADVFRSSPATSAWRERNRRA